MSWRNESQLFARSCSFSGERLISMFPPDTAFRVVRHKYWWGDSNDATRHGREWEPQRGIFEQMLAMQGQVPRFHVFNFVEERQENSLYTNCAGDNKDCYLIYGSGRNEKCLYGRYINGCFECVDTFFMDSCEGCYECTDCAICNNVRFAANCRECRDSAFLFDCRGCADCIGCAGLRQKRHCILNQQLSAADFHSRKTALKLDTRDGIADFSARFGRLLDTVPHRALHGERNEESLGDYLWDTKQCRFCFDCRNAEDCSYCTWFCDGKDSMDVFAWGECELCYEASGCGSDGMYGCAFAAKSIGCKHCFYIDHCMYCTNCFACTGLNRKQYCVLNRQYSRDEYEALVPRIIDAMTARGEWGEFFPIASSPWGYNHTVAQEYYPLSRSQALNKGYRWSDYASPPPAVSARVAAKSLPQSISEVGDDILQAAVECRSSGRLFRITKHELEIYRSREIPLPDLHPDVRQERRLLGRNPRRIRSIACAGCGLSTPTTYAPERGIRVYCDQCYLKQIT